MDREDIRENLMNICVTMRYYSKYNKAFQSAISTYQNAKKGKYVDVAKHSANAIDRFFDALDYTLKGTAPDKRKHADKQ